MTDDTPRGARRLETIFLTGPGGLVYEFPRELAARYQVTPERERELGHLPIVPYGTPVPAADVPADDEESEVRGRHLTVGPTGGRSFHRDPRFGTYRWSDGYYYQGEHYHPYGDETGQAV